MAKTAKEVLTMGKNVQMVDLRFIDLPGTWQHFSIPASTMDESLFEEGIGFDGSSIRGFKEINESDMLLILNPDTAYVDTTLEIPTLVVICDVYDPITRQPYERDPRYVAKKAEAYLKQSGIAATGIGQILHPRLAVQFQCRMVNALDFLPAVIHRIHSRSARGEATPGPFSSRAALFPLKR